MSAVPTIQELTASIVELGATTHAAHVAEAAHAAIVARQDYTRAANELRDSIAAGFVGDGALDRCHAARRRYLEAADNLATQLLCCVAPSRYWECAR